jgi:predicted nucleic acid-binding Zn finger protein
MAATQFEIKVPGSNGREYTIKRARNNGSWYCSCPAWKFQHKAPADRTCKHINALAAQFAEQMAVGQR